MVEYKQVLYDLRTTYNGPFLAEDFYAEIENWIKENGFEKEPKKKMEHVTKNGKKIEWLISIHSHLGEVYDEEITLRALLDNVKEIVINKNGEKIRINNGDVFVNVDGFIRGWHCATWWQLKPIYYFIRALVDKYIYKFWSEKYDGGVQADCHDLFKRIRSFFGLEKYKYTSL